LGANTGLDPDRVFAVTSSNPFFVTEVLTSDDVGAVPPTIIEAVGAAERSRWAGQGCRGAAAVVPSAVERWLVEQVVPGGLGSLAAAEQCGVLSVSPNRVTFRHELTRRAIVDSMPTSAGARNQAILVALLARKGATCLDPPPRRRGRRRRRDRFARTSSSPQGGSGVARERRALPTCTDQWRSLRPTGGTARDAIECYTVGLAELAVAAKSMPYSCAGLGDPVALGLSLRWLSRITGRAPGEAEARASRR
jgi:hypothetical protein